MIRSMPVLGVFLLACVLGCGGGDQASAPTKGPTLPKGPASPEEAVQLLAAGAKAGDVDKVLAQLTPSLAKMKKTMMQIGSEEVVFLTVLDSKFGKDITPQQRFFQTTGEWRDSIRALKNIETTGKQEIKPDRVLLTIWETGDRIVETKAMAIKDASGWKLDYQRVIAGRPAKAAKRKAPDGKEVEVQVEEAADWAEPDPKAADAYMKSLERYRGAIGQISQDVSTGQYETREAAETARKTAATTAFQGLAK